jgi:CheY-like chemotaxis protein
MIAEKNVGPGRDGCVRADLLSGNAVGISPEATGVRSEPLSGRGATALARPGARAGEGSAAEPRKRVLVVDDNVGTAESLALILSLWGHESRVAYNGLDAIRSAQDYLPDVILLDLGLPGLDGFSLARQLREDPRFRSTDLLAMTGYREDGDGQLAVDVGINRIFIKPLDLLALETELARQPASGPSDDARHD